MINQVSQLPLAMRWAASLGIGLALLTIWAICCVCALRGCPCCRSSASRRGGRHRYGVVDDEELAEVDDGALGDLMDELEDEMEMYQEEAMLVRAAKKRPPQTLLVELNGAVCGTVPLATSACRTVAALRKRAVEAAGDLTGGLTIKALTVLEYLDEAANLAIAIKDNGQLRVALSVPTLKATFQSAAYRRGLIKGGTRAV